jgi:hypothetical protein
MLGKYSFFLVYVSLLFRLTIKYKTLILFNLTKTQLGLGLIFNTPKKLNHWQKKSKSKPKAISNQNLIYNKNVLKNKVELNGLIYL